MESYPNPDIQAWSDRVFDASDQEVIRILSKFLTIKKEDQENE